jgi:hypothetical protein
VRNIWQRGLYAEQLEAALDILGQLVIIPSDVYYQAADQTISGLLALVHSRSGKSPPSGHFHSGQAPHANSHTHATLENSMDVSTDGAYLSQYYRRSNRRVYQMIQSGDSRLTVLPPRSMWPASIKDHFLETSAALRPYAQPR